jgi:hypothetical protein
VTVVRCVILCAAADRYCAAITGVLPSDPLALADIEQAYFFIEDVFQVRPMALMLLVERG